MPEQSRGRDRGIEGEQNVTGGLPVAALRALDEAAARRAAIAAKQAVAEKEIGGRGGLEPVRFGDWEIKGKAVDF